MRKKLVLFFMLCFLMILGIGTMAVYANGMFWDGVVTNGKNIYTFEGRCICKYDMNGDNREVIYENLPYGIELMYVNDGYLFFEEYQKYPDGIATNSIFKVLNVEDYSVKSIMDNDTFVIKLISKEKIYFTSGYNGDDSPMKLYACDFNGDNLQVITENYSHFDTIKEIKGCLYYAEKEDVYNSNYIDWRSRIVKSDMDGSNHTVLHDWFDGRVLSINENDVIYYINTWNNDLRETEEICYRQNYSTGEIKEITMPYVRDYFFCNDKNNEYYIFNDYDNKKTYFYILLPTGEKKEIKTFDDTNGKMSFLNIIDGVLYYRDSGSYYYYDDDAQSWYQSNPLDVKSVRIYEPEITASPTTASLIVNSEYVTPVAYNINGSNYFKLRDLAYILDGTGSQFDVGWDSDQKLITINTGVNYNAVGGEMTSSADSQNVSASNAEISVNGQNISLTAYNIEGNNYFMLRDLGEYLGFDVDWDSASSSIIIETPMFYENSEDIEEWNPEDHRYTGEAGHFGDEYDFVNDYLYMTVYDIDDYDIPDNIEILEDWDYDADVRIDVKLLDYQNLILENAESVYVSFVEGVPGVDFDFYSDGTFIGYEKGNYRVHIEYTDKSGKGYAHDIIFRVN